MQNFLHFVWAAFRRKPYRPILAALLLLLGLYIGDITTRISGSSFAWLLEWAGNWWARWLFILLAAALLVFTFYRQSKAIRRAAGAKAPRSGAADSITSEARITNRRDELFAALERLRDPSRGKAPRSRSLSELVRLISERSAKLDDPRPVEVSVIVPVYNELAHTMICVLSLLEHATHHRFEVLIGDDCSTDRTIDVVGRIGGVVQLVRHAKNLGFLRNCNETAKSARGKYLVFLNNDTFVQDGWLDGLIGPFERFANAGLVGSMLLSADGRLQEAGGIVWNDGSAWNYGRNDDPDLPRYNYLKDAEAPEFNYLKDVDYCSGCSIAVRHDLWNELGGFDERYSPAYYEDVDLAFSLRARGYRTLYNPQSVLIHHEGATQGRDLNAGIKAYQVQNKKKFAEKWQNVLKANHYAHGEQVLFARDRSREKPRILIVDHYIPQFDRDTGSRTMFAYLKLLVDRGFHVIFWPHNLAFDPIYTRSAQQLGVEVIYGSHHVGKFHHWLDEQGPSLAYALLVRPHIATEYINFLKNFPEIKLLYFGVDIHFLRMHMEQAYNKSLALQRETKKYEAIERKIWSEVDVIYYPADFEVTFVTKKHPKRVSRLFPLYLFDPETIEDARRRAGAHTNRHDPVVIFCAGFAHPPNIDAAVWLVREIWPRVLVRYPNAKLYLVGSSPTPEVRALESSNVRVTDYVSDTILEVLYESADIAIVPMRYGGGVKGKIIEAMRFGVPTVTTSVGLQGIPDGARFLSVAEDTSGLAEAVIRLLADPAAAKAQAEAAVCFLAEHYSRERAEKLLALDIPEFADGV